MINIKTTKKLSITLGLSMGLSIGTTHAGVLEEVVVTAQKREQSVQDVGISITALSGDQIEALGYNNAQEITNLTPGVHTVQPNGESNYSLAIRGAANPDFVSNQESPVSIYVDEVYISQSSGTGFMLFDMERVEILRGPQGTLFGRNATGGLAHFITRKPSEEFEGYAKLTYGDYDQIKAEGAVSGPLSDTVSARLSASLHKNDGYIENRLSDDDLNNADDYAVRAQLLFEPSDSLSVLLNVRAAEQDIRTGFFENVYSEPDPNNPEFGILLPGQGVDAFGYADPDGNSDVYAGDYDRNGFNKLETFGTSATIKYNFANDVKLTSVTDFQTTERDYVEDTDAGPGDFFNFYLVTDAEQTSQELRLEGGNDKLQWVTGVYYLDIEIDDASGAEIPFFNAVGVPLGPNGEVYGVDNPYSVDKESVSLFGQMEYALNEEFTAIAGLRFIQDEVAATYVSNTVYFPANIADRNDPSNRNGNQNFNATLLNDILGTTDPIVGFDRKLDEDLWAGRLQLNYQPSDSGNLYYISYNRGVKGGGFNSIFDVVETLARTDRVQIDESLTDFQAEEVDAFEVGAKLDLADAARLNLAAYYNDYENYQAFNINGLDTRFTDSDAESTGFEAELQVSTSNGFDIVFGVGFNDTDITVPAILSTDGTTVVVPGYETTPVQSPEWNVSGLVRKAFNLSSGGELALQGDFVYRDEHFFNLNGGQGAQASTEDGYTLFNIRVSYMPVVDGAWQFDAYVNNVSDEEYLVQTFDLAGVGFAFTEQYYGKPRWWGVSARYQW